MWRPEQSAWGRKGFNSSMSGVTLFGFAFNITTILGNMISLRLSNSPIAQGYCKSSHSVCLYSSTVSLQTSHPSSLPSPAATPRCPSGSDPGQISDSSLNIKALVICIKDKNTHADARTTHYVYCLVIMGCELHWWTRALEFTIVYKDRRLGNLSIFLLLFLRRNCRLPLVSVVTSVYLGKQHQFLLKKIPFVSCTLTGTHCSRINDP